MVVAGRRGGLQTLFLGDQVLDVGEGFLGVVDPTVDPAGGLGRLLAGVALVVADGPGGGRDQEDGVCNAQVAVSGRPAVMAGSRPVRRMETKRKMRISLAVHMCMSTSTIKGVLHAHANGNCGVTRALTPASGVWRGSRASNFAVLTVRPLTRIILYEIRGVAR